MTRKECLDKAAECVLRDRNNAYGGPEDSFGVIANFWSVYLGRKVYPADVAMMMSLLKIARIKANKGYADGYIDLAGYAACGAECAMPECDAEPIFRPGDKVQFCLFPHADVWLDGIVERVEGCHCFIRRSNGEEVSAPKRLIRRPCAEGCEEPKFKPGDRVQYRVELPSVSDWIWRDATYLRPAFSWQQDGEHIVSSDDLGPVTVKDKDIRPAPKAEGCEALVEKDAPQTPQELYQHIVDCNPATFHTPSYAEEQLEQHSRLQAHKPTGEELAEMAEEAVHE